MEKNHLLLVDGMALLFRAFYATAVRKQFMINKHGLPTNAVQGYLRHFLTALENLSPTHAAVCWDMGRTTFRNEIFQEYKSNREAPPAELLPQFDLAKEATEAFEVPNIGLKGFEADDCIGTICSQLKEDTKVTVLTGDRDLLQIIDEQVDVWIMQKGIGNYAKFNRKAFIDSYQLEPSQLVDVKALMGDSSDGYPGVKGIGEKTAIKLIQQFGDIETLLMNLPELTPSQRKKIENDLEMLHISRELAQIHCSAPVTINIHQTGWEGVPQSAFDLVEEQELWVVRNHLKRMEEENPFAEWEMTR